MYECSTNLHTKKASHLSHNTKNSLCSHCLASMELDIGVTHSDLTLESWFSSDTSTGYLEDAIADWGIWFNQNNLPSYSQDQNVNYKSQYLVEVDKEDLFPTFASTTTQILHDHTKFSNRNPSSSQNNTHAAAVKHDTSHRSCASRVSEENDASVSRGHWKKIAYPFELVKPGGVEGVTTLKDINHQLLMSPLKPIPHPVGDSITHPCNSARGFGITGKAVTALTRIHTQGRGSITIIRTKG
ncbi:uncharacterized protein LOC133284139 isoform X2 [Gastrolobium bilobum]|uniref:uncharacterized protein LOC133284139 isoform X2 n=1 Tax=Gastrolobium bilobum TaxID=150636 RepID=UPI002AB2D42F|nr:uncharacterized protein LOC133284139 isoform X2 [Gastrolobium bilobum]